MLIEGCASSVGQWGPRGCKGGSRPRLVPQHPWPAAAANRAGIAAAGRAGTQPGPYACWAGGRPLRSVATECCWCFRDLDTPGIGPRAHRMLSGCDTTTTTQCGDRLLQVLP